ncbi:MAG TPA: RDD family protein [Thermoleophilaceae bacterium]|nr:RDD family protein [Thermoleophilaceae bacterium]
MTRALAFAIDAAIVDLTGIAVGVVVGLALSVLNTPDDVDKALLAAGGVIFVLWTVGYFVVFWSATGETPGDRVMRIRVECRDGRTLTRRTAALRLVALGLAAIPLLAGFVPVLFDRHRRALQDFVARSVVVRVPG